MRAYILALAPSSLLDGFDRTKFHDNLIKAKGVLTWWHYLPDVYIIVVDSDINASSVSDYVATIAPGRNFIVTHFDLYDHNGRLPKGAWDWINEQRDRYHVE